MADNFNLQKLLPINFLIQAVIFFAIAMTGFNGGEYAYVQFAVWLSALGPIQSLCFPAFVHVVANWFSAKRRGIAVAAFVTCVNVGNILGAQLGQALLRGWNDQWQWLFVLLSGLFVVLAAAIWLLLVQHPETIGIMIDREVVSAKVENTMQLLQHSSQTFVHSASRSADNLMGDGQARKPGFRSEVAPSKGTS